MSRLVANVDVITDSFEIWLLETNELLHALSTEIITANATYANTGNSTFQRTAQLYGTFGSNNLVVTNWMKGGNVNGSFANLMISTNTVLSNVNATEIRLEVANGSSNTFVWQYGLHAGLTGANLVANTTKLTVQSNSTTNSTANATLISVSNSTISANMTSNSFTTGISKVSNVEINVGANLIANSSALLVGNSSQNSVLNYQQLTIGNTTVNTAIVSNSETSYIDTDGYLRVLGNANFSNSVLVIGNTTLANTLDVTGAATLSNTLAVTGAATLSNTLAVTGAATLSNTLAVTGAATLSSTLAVIGNTTLSNTLVVTGNTTLANTLDVTGNTTFSNTLAVTGAATHANIVTFKSDHVLDVFANGNLGATTNSDLLIFEYPKSEYSSAKLLIQLKNTGNTQISEVLLAHDTSIAQLTTYGTVSSPVAANSGVNLLGTFSANVATANVRVYVNQTRANSAAKVVAQFIK